MQETTDTNLEQIRVAIQREFIDRCRKNPAYSLRAYAKYLEIDQSFLSKLLRGQRAVTKKLAQTVAPKLGLKPAQIKALFQRGAASMPGFLSLSEDEFEFLSEWHHFAILELSKTKDFDSSPAMIARRLGIHVEEIRTSLERLERLGFIRIGEKGFKLLSPNNTWTNTQSTSNARKKFQRSLLEKSIDALDHVDFDLRENGSVTLAIDSSRLPEFKQKLKEMRQELAQYFQGENEKKLDEVYQLTVSFFPLTQTKKNKRSDSNEEKI